MSEDGDKQDPVYRGVCQLIHTANLLLNLEFPFLHIGNRASSSDCDALRLGSGWRMHSLFWHMVVVEGVGE